MFLALHKRVSVVVIHQNKVRCTINAGISDGRQDHGLPLFEHSCLSQPGNPATDRKWNSPLVSTLLAFDMLSYDGLEIHACLRYCIFSTSELGRFFVLKKKSYFAFHRLPSRSPL